MSELPEMRIGDRERLAAQDRLRDAYGQGALDLDELDERLELALKAKTGSDLVPILSDLPGPAGAQVSLAKAEDGRSAKAPELAPVDAGHGWGHDVPWGWIFLVVVLLGGLGAGDRLVGGLTNADAVTVFGSDTVVVDEESDDVRLLTVFGSVEVIVEEGAEVRESMISIFGSSECDVTCTAGDTEQSTTVSGLTLFGSVEFVSRADAEADADD